MKNLRFSIFKRFCVAFAFILGFSGNAQAVPTLTAAAVTDGFGLSLFADNFPTTGFCCGPLGIAFLPGGGVMVSDYPGNVRVFPTSADGQHANTIPVAQNYGFANGVGMTRIGNFVYMARQGASDVVRLNLDGTFNSTVVTGLLSATGVYANPVTHKLYVSDCCSGTGIWEVDTVTNVKTQLITGFYDGLSVSADGGTIYAATGGHIVGYNLATMTVVFDSGFIPGGVDGTELGAGTLAGEIFAWTNSGDLWEVDLATPATQRILVTGGARGDFVTADPNGSLLMVTTDQIWRLTAPLGGCIGTACGNDVPEPGSLVLVAMGLLGLSRVIRKTRLPI
jgi:hypothetical protein